LSIQGLLSTVVIDRRDVRFVSEVPEANFLYLKDIVLPPLTSVVVQVQQQDVFYPDGVRVSYNKNKELVTCIQKKRLKHQDFFNPHLPSFDFRLSASEEKEVPRPASDVKPLCLREKTRSSFVFDTLLQIDLTRVKSWSKVDGLVGSGPAKVSYEVELELLDYTFIRQEVAKHKEKKKSELPALAAFLLSNIRALAKAAILTK
jgi:hypothetical protein